MGNDPTANIDIPPPSPPLPVPPAPLLRIPTLLRRFAAPLRPMLTLQPRMQTLPPAMLQPVPAPPLQAMDVDRQPVANRFSNLYTYLSERLRMDINTAAAAVSGAAAALRHLGVGYYQGMAFGEEDARSKLEFIVGCLFSLVQLKSPGIPGFPYQTHPLAIIFSVTGVVSYFFASVAEFVMSAAGVDRASPYAIIAHLVKMSSLFILVASLASLLCF